MADAAVRMLPRHHPQTHFAAAGRAHAAVGKVQIDFQRAMQVVGEVAAHLPDHATDRRLIAQPLAIPTRSRVGIRLSPFAGVERGIDGGLHLRGRAVFVGIGDRRQRCAHHIDQPAHRGFRYVALAFRQWVVAAVCRDVPRITIAGAFEFDAGASGFAHVEIMELARDDLDAFGQSRRLRTRNARHAQQQDREHESHAHRHPPYSSAADPNRRPFNPIACESAGSPPSSPAR